MEIQKPPFIPTNGRILVQALPYKPSKILEVFTHDKADETESIVVALSPFRYGRKKSRKGWEHTGVTFPHEVKIGDRVIHAGSYADEDTITINRVKYRSLDSWEIMGVLEAEQPKGFEDPLSGEMKPDTHPHLSVTL